MIPSACTKPATRSEIALSGPTEVGLGDDVTLRVSPGAQGIAIEVLRGLDRGERVVAGEQELRVDGLAATFVFEHPTRRQQADALRALGAAARPPSGASVERKVR